MSGNVVQFTGETELDSSPERVLEIAGRAKLKWVIVIGLCEDDSEFFAPSMASGPSCLWALERAKKRLLEVIDDCS